jgi:heptosyltransferase-1
MSTPSRPAPEPRRILIVRLSALGDIVMASGLIPALKARYPQAEISWICEGVSAPLLKHNPRLHELIIWPRGEWEALKKAKRWGELWRAVRAFRAMLRSKQFDLVLDGQGLLKSGLMGWFTGAPRRVSIIAREGSHVLAHEVVVPEPAEVPVMGSEYRYLAGYLGAPEGAFQPDLAVGAAQLATARAKVAGVGKPLVALCPFTTRPQKHWVEAHWPALAARLIELGWQPVLLGGPADVPAAQRIAQATPGLINLVGQLKLDESVALISLCRRLIGVDTGLTHMGTALKVPTLALFGSTRPYLSGGSPLTHVMYDALPCSPCRRNPTCDGRFDCMAQLTVQRVLDAALALPEVAA